VNFENFGHTAKNKIVRLVKLLARLSYQVAGGGGVRSLKGEVVGDRITGGSAKKILILVQRNQILLARSYYLCEDAPGRMST